MISVPTLYFASTARSRTMWKTIAILLLVTWVGILAGPELLRDRIYPIGSALSAADGALFHSLFAELPDFLRDPMGWLWGYYDQYPALSLRRRPPLFPFFEGAVYAVTGVSVFGAKATLFLFSVAFVLATFFVSLRMSRSGVVAFGTAFLVASTPTLNMFFRSIWLYVPSLAFCMLSFLFYLRYLDRAGTFWTTLLPLAVFSALTLYTYQPPLLLLLGLFIHLIWMEGRTILRNRSLLLAGGVFLLLMTPLVLYTVAVAPDNVRYTSGAVQPEWKEFADPSYSAYAPILDKTTLGYWTCYAEMVLHAAPVQCAGLALWLALWPWRRPAPAEGLFLLTMVVAYLGFSWLPIKGPGYAIFILVPLSMLTAPAIRDAATLVWRKQGTPVTASLFALLLPLSLAQALYAKEESVYYYASGFDKAVDAILETRPSAHVLYSGRFDAAFVFYLRAADDHRQARVARASVQLPNPDNLIEYLQREAIDVIAYESKNPETPLRVIDEFRRKIEDYLKSTNTFVHIGRFEVPYWGRKRKGIVLVEVFERRRPA